MHKRKDGRHPDEVRPIAITPGFMKRAEGSALIEMGDTRVICTVSVENRVPPFLSGKQQGWLTAEYAMLPRSTHTRTQRETQGPKGRSQEIQRLIGRALRGIVDLKAFGERTLWIDCDVLSADGGTRTASISGAYIAVAHAFAHLGKKGQLLRDPLKDSISAVSVGILGGTPCLDLCYEEDASAEVDMNVVMTGKGRYVEVQGTAEGNAFTGADMDRMLALARKGIKEITAAQMAALPAS